MDRREYLLAATAATVAPLAGCTDDDTSPDGGSANETEPNPVGDEDADEPFDPQTDMPTVEEWVREAVSVIQAMQTIFLEWQNAPEEFTTEDFDEIAERVGPILDQWETDIQPMTADMRDTEFERSVGGETWTVDGAELHDVLIDLRGSVAAVIDGAERIRDANADPGELADEDPDALEEMILGGQAAIEGARRLLDEGGE